MKTTATRKINIYQKVFISVRLIHYPDPLTLPWQTLRQPREQKGLTGHTISTVVKHLQTFSIFALTSISFKDFPFLKDIIGGSLKIK